MTEINQGSDFYINIVPPPTGSIPEPVAARYVIYDRAGTILLQKNLGSGIAFQGGNLVIHLNDVDTSGMPPGKYFHECVVRDLDQDDTFLLQERVTIKKTIARNQ